MNRTKLVNRLVARKMKSNRKIRCHICICIATASQPFRKS